jgi:predicted ATPase/DNA-binding SARP family transcriptional activator/uncharacterized protein HemY
MSNKVPALLAYLLVTRRPQPREVLAGLLWGELSEEDARNNLRQALSNLRKYLDPFLEVTRNTIAFKPDLGCRIDVYEFERLTSPRPDELDAASIRDHCLACQIYQGRFLNGLVLRDAPAFEEWQLSLQANYHERVIHIMARLTDHFLAYAQYDQANEYAARLLTFDSWREEAHRQRMLALAHSGQRSAALAQYKTCARLLRKELGVEPSVETRALYQRILTLGNRPPNNLPQQPTPFIDRVNELARINECLSKPGCRLHNLVGAGGMGKTRLALQAAEQAYQRGQFLDGVFYVPLAKVDSIPLLNAFIGQAIGLRFSGNHSPTDQLVSFLRQKEMLLVLDNFDHLVAEDSTQWFDKILENAPSITFLITSREKIQSRWERSFLVEGLPYPENDDWQNPLDYPSVRLFMERARAAGAEIELNAENKAGMCKIFQALMGMPLGIELAAVQARDFSCSEIASSILNNLAFLTSTYRDLPDRHRSLLAVFETSWELLPAQLRQVFASLGVFHGSFSRTAALEIAGASLEVLNILVEKSLLRKTPQGRFQLHNMLRLFADQQLDQETRAGLESCHARYYTNWLGLQYAHISTGQQVAILREISEDYENIFAAWNWCLEHQEYEQLIQAVGVLRQFFSIKSRFHEGINWLEPARQKLMELELVDKAGEALARIEARLAAFYARVGYHDKALKSFEMALTLAQKYTDSHETGFILLNLGFFTLMSSANFDLAEQQFLDALRNYQKVNDIYGEANVLSALGGLYNIIGKWDESQACLEKSVSIFTTHKDTHGLCSALTNLGNVYYLRGDLENARRYYLEVVPLCQQIGDLNSQGIILSNLGAIASEKGEYTEAEQLLQQGLKVFYKLNSPMLISQANTMLSKIYRSTGQFQSAKETLQQAFELTFEQEMEGLFPHILFELANLYQSLEQNQASLILFYWVAAAPASEAEHRRDARIAIEKLQQCLDQPATLEAQGKACRLDLRQVQSDLANWVIPE